MVNPRLVEVRQESNEAAVVFVHGFGGKSSATWGQFPVLLAQVDAVRRWDILSLGYPTRIGLDLPLWSGDPDLTELSLTLRTRLSLPPLASYRSIALIAHSMGGLIAQHALLDRETAARVSHCLLFGTPSLGLAKARYGGLLKRQVTGMADDAPFIRTLRAEWSEQFSVRTPFVLRVVQGEEDRFVSASSSLGPFPESLRRVVPGHHVAMVKPESVESLSVHLVVDALTVGGSLPSVIDSARLAVEQRQFQAAIDLLLPNAKDLDEAALAQLALALDSRGRGAEALQILEEVLRERREFTSTDALGVLAGRTKRRWLVERVHRDWMRARELYQAALDRTLAAAPEFVDYDQAMYHAINIAFLDLVSLPRATRIPQKVFDQAALARTYAERASAGHWRSATIAESLLIEGEIDGAVAEYARAVGAAPTARDIDSMYGDAITIADYLQDPEIAVAIERAFSST